MVYIDDVKIKKRTKLIWLHKKIYYMYMRSTLYTLCLFNMSVNNFILEGKG